MKAIIALVLVSACLICQNNALTCYKCSGPAESCGADTCTTDATGFCYKAATYTKDKEMVQKGCIAVGVAGCTHKDRESTVNTCMCNSDYCNSGSLFRHSSWALCAIFVFFVLKNIV